MSSSSKGFSIEKAFSKVVSAVKSRLISAWEFLTGLPEDSQTWGFGTVCFFACTVLIGGPIFNSSLIAMVFCAGTWALLLERPTWGLAVSKVGLGADFVITAVASMFMAGTSVSVAFAAVFFGVYFTACRRIITPMLPDLVAAWRAKQEEEAAKEEGQDEQALTLEGGAA